MRPALPCAALLAAAVGVVAAPAASAAPARAAAAAPVTLTAPAPAALVGSPVSFAEATHLPAAPLSWTLTFGDGTRATGHGAVPRSVKHTFHKTFGGTAVLTVATANGRSYAGHAKVTVSALTGRVFTGIHPLRGALVSIVDDHTGDLFAVVRADAKGLWSAPPSMKKAHTAAGYDVLINRDFRLGLADLGGTDPRFNFDERDGVKAGAKQLDSSLPPVATVTGTVTNADGTAATGGVVFAADAQPGGGYLEAVGVIDGTGHYSITLGAGEFWGIEAFDRNGTLMSSPTNVQVPTTVPITGPSLALTTPVPTS